MREFDLMYINTVAVIDYLIAARFFRSKTILHVHEIPSGFWASLVLRFLVRSAEVRTIFNSASTRGCYAPLQNTSHVLYNGCPSPVQTVSPEYRRERRLRVLVIGRLNSWKGQDVLIEACGRLPPEVRRCLDARIVGGSFDSDTALEQSLHGLVEHWKCADCITFEPFSERPESWYQWSDIVVVPSKLPEPFGRVAIEAMSFGRALIVSATGGLVEIVQDGLNGWHVSPNDPLALARALSKAVSEPELIAEIGRQGRQRFQLHFRQETIDEEFAKIVHAQISEKKTRIQKTSKGACQRFNHLSPKCAV